MMQRLYYQYRLFNHHVYIFFNLQYQRGMRPLRGACYSGHLEAARQLIEKGADLEAKDMVR